MNGETIKLVDEVSIKLSHPLYALMYNGKLMIFEKVNVYGMGYKLIVSLSYDDFEKLVDMSEEEKLRIHLNTMTETME